MAKKLTPSDFGSLQNYLYATAKMVAPEVGMGATRISWTDRHCYTIVEVVSPTEILVQKDKVIHEKNGYVKVVEQDPNYPVERVLKLSNGSWVTDGQHFFIGERLGYQDPHF